MKRNPFFTHFIMSGYYFAPDDLISEKRDNTTNKTLIVAILQMIGVSLLVSTLFLSMIDGPEVVKELLSFNFQAHSMFLYDYVIYSVLFLWGLVAGIAWLLPLILYIIQIKLIQKNDSVSGKQMIIASCYAYLPLLMLMCIINSIAMLVMGGSIHLIQFELGDWQNVQFYITGGLLVFSLFASIKLNEHYLGLKNAERFFVPIAMLIVLLAVTPILFII